MAAVGKSGQEKGIKAGCIIRAAARALGGGPNVEKLDEALLGGKSEQDIAKY